MSQFAPNQTQQLPNGTGAQSILNSDAWMSPSAASLTTAQPSQPATAAPSSPAPAAAPARPVAADPGTAPITASSPNVKTHSFVARAASGLLSALAGEPGPNYSTDASGRLIASKAAPLTTAQKLARIVNTIGTGLSAPDPGPQKSGLAAAAAGFGAGFGAEQKALTDADRAKQKQATDNWEREQQSLLHRAQVGQNLALTARNWAEAQKLGADMDPQRQAGMAL